MRYLSRIFVLAFLLVLPLAATQAEAQLDCSDPDLLALVFDGGDINTTANGPEVVTAQLVLINPSAYCLGAIEFNLQITNAVFLGATWVVEHIDLGTGGTQNRDFIVGFSQPVQFTEDVVPLAEMTFLYTGTGSVAADFFFHPGESFSSVPGEIVYVDCDHPDQLIPMDPISMDFELPVARINGEPLDYCHSGPDLAWTVNIATAGDENNVAGVAYGASDGFEAEYDLLDESADRRIYFPHPDYPGAPDLRQDIRAAYDPLTDIKQWHFVVDSYAEPPTQSGGGDNTVLLNLTTDLGFSAELSAYLQDEETGGSMPLTPGMQYSYSIPYGSSTRDFTLVIGTDPVVGPDPVEFSFRADMGSLHDTGNLAGTDELATMGFDAGLDVPEPGPPPSVYLNAHFHHEDWPLGPRYQTDIQPPFDPLVETRVWPIAVETDQSGYVQLSFTPNFTEADGIPFKLRALGSGMTFDLFPSLTYEFFSSGATTTRIYEVLVGGESGPPEVEPTERALPVGWSLVGLPLLAPAAGATLDDVILDQSPGFSYMFGYDTAGGAYQMLEGAAEASQTKGYWIANTQPFAWSLPGGSMALDGTLSALVPGWNLVAYPQWFNGPVSAMEVVHDGATYSWATAVDMGLVNPNVLTYNNLHDFYTPTETLEPWHAYWIRAHQTDVALSFNWRNFVELPALRHKLDLSLVPVEQKWRTDLVLQAGERGTRLITCGVHPGASGGFDMLHDTPAAPRSPAGGPTFAFDRPGYEEECGRYYTSDFVAVDTEKFAWDAVITTPSPMEVTLSWTPFDWPREHDLQLYLPDQNRVVVLSMAKEFSTTLEVGDKPLRIRVRTPDATSGVEDLPGLSYALKAYPNPFNPMTTLSYTLARAGLAEIKIFSVRGELVDTLVGERLEAGPHQVTWRGKDRNHAGVPSGSYFAKLYVDGKDVGQVIKMSLVR